MPVLKISTSEFVGALKRLVPKRMTVALRSSELYIGRSDNEAVFCINGAETRCRVLEAEWNGFAVVNFGQAFSLAKAPPPSDIVSLKWADGRLRIDTMSLPAIWSEAPEWIASMVTDAHLHDLGVPPESKRYCPRCGKRKGEPVEATARQWPTTPPVATRLSVEHANMQCKQCSHAWCDIG